MVAVCPRLLTAGVCADTACVYKHDVHICRVCSVVCYSAHLYQVHLGSKGHHKKASGLSAIYWCPACQTHVSGANNWTFHVAGRRHINACTTQGLRVDLEPEESVTLPGYTHCAVCKTDVRQEWWVAHLRSRSHTAKLAFSKYEAAFDEAEKDKHGIKISHPSGGDFGIVDSAISRDGVYLAMTIANEVPLSNITFVSAKQSSQAGARKAYTSFSISSSDFGRKVQYGRELRLSVCFEQVYLGRYEDRVELVFRDNTISTQFVIVRPVRGIVGSQADHDLLKPTAPYVPRKHVEREDEREVIPGERPEALKAIPYVTRLPHCPIPSRIATLLGGRNRNELVSDFRASALPALLDSDTHGQHFKALIWAEEHRAELDLAIYDIEKAQLTQHNQFYRLEVPGLAEKRPSVLVGDRILVKPSGTPPGTFYEGYVHDVLKSDVVLCLNRGYVGHYVGKTYNIRFKLNRIPLRRQHQALDTAYHPERLLFPLRHHVLRRTPPPTATMAARVHNRQIAGNPAQVQAVASIVNMAPGSAPFVVFGPPGTGKTVTVVEAMIQLLRHDPSARILACAPSNSAADLLAERLLPHLPPSELFRFYAPSRNKNTVPDALLEHACRKPSGHFSVPPMAALKRFRVVIATCVSAGFVHGVGVPRGHFSHIFVDEAGQATEPEVMIALRTMADNATNIVLSGDPKQLGPIVRSPAARKLGLEKSYLERLMQREAYNELEGHGTSVVKLVQNFRSHERILRFPNERFYGGDLRPHGAPRVIDAYIGSSILPARDFPVIVHSIAGRDLREASSPSFFNVDEVSQVKQYVQMLRTDRKVRITDAEIGIIAPYHAQCQKIRTGLLGIADSVKVGSVEEFQGQERRVIIISTVRSSRDFVEYDIKHTLGFVANPRRFNVAVTRAQALLIVVGDPSVLSLDPLWRAFLNYAYTNGGWRGPPPSWDTDEAVDAAADYHSHAQTQRLASMDDFARRMEALTLQGVAEDDEDANINVDRPWREVE